MNPPQLYYASQGSDDVFVPTNYKQQLSLWNEQHLNQRYSQQGLNVSFSSASGVNGCDEIHELIDEEECVGENDIVLIKVNIIFSWLTKIVENFSKYF